MILGTVVDTLISSFPPPPSEGEMKEREERHLRREAQVCPPGYRLTTTMNSHSEEFCVNSVTGERMKVKGSSDTWIIILGAGILGILLHFALFKKAKK